MISISRTRRIAVTYTQLGVHRKYGTRKRFHATWGTTIRRDGTVVTPGYFMQTAVTRNKKGKNDTYIQEMMKARILGARREQ